MDIRTLRYENNVKQKDIAAAIDVSLTELSKWERGLEFPDNQSLAKLASFYRTSVQELKSAQEEFIERIIPGEGYVTAKSSNSFILERSEEPDNHKLKVLDLFCGAGGFSYGMESTGYFNVTCGIDLLEDRIKTFHANHPFASTICADITTYPLSELKKVALSPDVVVGGPPCQGFSSIRPFRKLTEGDPRNSLLEQFVLVVDHLRPKYCILENVVGLITHQNGAVLNSVLKGLEDIGYTPDWRVLNAANYGLPQNRERVVIVGSAEGMEFPWPIPTHYTDHKSMAGSIAKRIDVPSQLRSSLKPAVTVMEAIGDLPKIDAGKEASTYTGNASPSSYAKQVKAGSQSLTLHKATRHSEEMLEIIKHAGENRSSLPEGMTSSGFSSCYSRLSPDKPSVTLTVNFVHPSSNKCIHPYQHRALTPREGARIQGFPDTFSFCGSRGQIVKQIGNAVPPLLGAVIGNSLFEAFDASLISKKRRA